MNKDLQGREYNIPQEIINFLRVQLNNQTGESEGSIRAENLVQKGKVDYNLLKKILHDMKTMDRENELSRYNLYGGELFEKWGWKVLNDDRTSVQNRKKSEENANNISGLSGTRKNPHNKTHEKSSLVTSFSDLTGIKSNSEKSSISSLKLFEEINRIKTLIKW